MEMDYIAMTLLSAMVETDQAIHPIGRFYGLSNMQG